MIAIIGIMVGLLLPAIQAAQESGRRSTCANNLKQNALAIQGYIDARRTFPLGLSSVTGWAWSAEILPFNEGEDIYSQLDLTRKIGVAGGNRTAIDNSRVSGTRCPSAKGLPEFRRAFNGEAMTHWIQNTPTSSYQGNFGPLYASGNSSSHPTESQCCLYGGIAFMGSHANFRGIFAVGGSPVKPILVTDGLSNTFLIGESNWESDVGVWFGSVDYGNNATNNGKVSTQNAILRTCQYKLNRYYTGTNEQTRGFGSMHSGGAQMAFCDGAVKFITDGIQHTETAAASFTTANLPSVGVYQLLSCRNDGQSVGNY